jgi:VWFA-related protein
VVTVEFCDRLLHLTLERLHLNRQFPICHRIPLAFSIDQGLRRVMKLIGTALLQMILIAVFSAPLTHTFGQKSAPKPPPDQPDDVVRVNTELVQSDVTVFDKQGRFVDGLQADQFELRIDGKPQPVVFFERVTTGSAAEEKQLSAAREQKTTPTIVNKEAGRSAADRGRVVFFFVDDRHLTAENVTRTRKALSQFIENEMLQNDLVAVVSTSGRIGFLQQLTTNKSVLRAAVARLSDQRKTEAYAGKVPISEYDADQVALGNNRELFNYLVLATAAEFQMDPALAANMVRNRVAQVEAQARASTTDTLTVLESLMRSSAPLPGRKIIFFISGGFVTDPRGSSVFDRLHRVTKTAAQVGAVIYTMDARGTFVNIYTDASTNPYPDFTGHVSRNVFAEGQATQESLHTLADDTGGRAFLGSNSFADGFRQALAESSNYYLLAWRPAREEDRGGKTRFTVSIKGRPDLKVRVRRGFMGLPALANVSTSTKESGSESSPDSELLAALGSLYPVRALPVSLSVGYVNTPSKGMMLTATMRIDLAAFDPTSLKDDIDVMGVALDDRGSIFSFKQKVNINPEAMLTAGQNFALWKQDLFVRPGLYQVRVAVRDRKTGRTGSAMQWLEIPKE